MKTAQQVMENKKKGILGGKLEKKETRAPLLADEISKRVRKAAFVLARMTEDLVDETFSENNIVCRSMVWAAFRILHWVDEAVRSGQTEMLLRCLVEASCANLALRGLLMECERMEKIGPRRCALVVSQSRRLEQIVKQLCEFSGKNAAGFNKPLYFWALSE